MNRRAIRQERHVFFRQNTGNDTFVTVTSGHFVAFGDFTLLCDVDANQLVDARRQLVAVLTRKHLHVHDDSVTTVRNAQRGIAHFASLLTEDRMQETLFSRQLGYALRRYLTNENVASANFGTDADDSALVKVLERFFPYVRNIAGDFLRTELRVTSLGFVLLDMDRSVHVLFDQLLGEKNRILVVVAFPSHERNDNVAAQCQFSHLGGWSVSQDVTFFDHIATLDDWTLIDACSLVRTHKFV
ncbi:Uncharacterised protein [Actinobacillus pleuropneumoniae]|nr:Uncharacterised protein [Actinobacillus pleuropneumoniae]